MSFRRSLPLLLLYHLTIHAQGGFLSESSSGDLSNNWQAPSVLAIDHGSNFVSGTTTLDDPDLFSVHVPNGLEIIEVRVAFYDFFAPGNFTFMGFQDGPTLLQDPAAFTADSSEDISFILFGEFDQGTDMLPIFSSSPNATSGSLGEGSYAFWINEIEPQTVTYAFDFVADVAPVPEPGTLALFGVALPLLLRRRRSN